MALKFIDFKKKLGRKKYLELNFEQEEGTLLAIVDNDKDNLKILKKVFKRTESYDGQVIINGMNILDSKNTYPYLQEDIGFYDLFTIEQNFKKLMKLSGVDYDKENLTKFLNVLQINGNQKYIELTTENQKNIKILFSYFVSSSLFLLDFTEGEISKNTSSFYLSLVEDFLKDDKGRTFIIFSEHLNEFTNLCDLALVISDNKQAYFGDASNLNVVKDLIIIELAEVLEEDRFVDLRVDYKIIDSSIIIMKDDLETVLYYLVRENIEVISINDFNENTQLYKEGGALC